MSKIELSGKLPFWVPYITVLKDLIMLSGFILGAAYNFGAKMNTASKTQLEDHIAIQKLQEQVTKMEQSQGVISGEVNFLVQSTFKERQHENDGK